MAHLLQRLAAALILVGAAQAAPFSHRVHLKLQLTCTNCHTAAASSTTAEDNLLPGPSVCISCHVKGGPGPALPSGPKFGTRTKPSISKFSHQQHLRLGNISPILASAIDHKKFLSAPGEERRFLNSKNVCEACHRGLHESDAVSPANLPRMADCLVCHTQIDPPFSCATCHDQGATLMPASHVPGWVDIHSSGKAHMDKQSCAVCHGRTFTCRGCH